MKNKFQNLGYETCDSDADETEQDDAEVDILFPAALKLVLLSHVVVIVITWDWQLPSSMVSGAVASWYPCTTLQIPLEVWDSSSALRLVLPLSPFYSGSDGS
eukprot:CAMPEP_0198250510 /NCGR_PEP_ID=MMETSP1447-20131203/1676_1 /TAXON_ID=420782 /ORGANISM="Chaetoceros dichaeta, Strain CCMP1751" /LENGTH=101 /DNA_ID=CAMNT_0043935357 /DNA_START=407 /DNA_END=708 /DNA_ORIENTATION=+